MGTGSASRERAIARAVKGYREISFADVNPLTGVPFMQSKFDDLPYLVGLLASYLVGERKWDRMVETGELAEEFDCFARRQIPFTLDCSVPVVSGKHPTERCEDCWGTGVVGDVDGSMTGFIGCAFVCSCQDL